MVRKLREWATKMDNITRIISTIRYKNNACFFDSISNCKYANIKGEALAVLAYGKTGARKSNDIDILTSRKDFGYIENALLNDGYHSNTNRMSRIMLLSQSHQIAPYIRKTGQIELNIDINFDIFWGEYTGNRIELEDFLSDTIEMEIYGVKVKSLPPLKAMIQLILHHYKDMNSLFLLATRKSIKYEMFKDVYYLLKNNLEAISLDKLYEISAEYEIIPYVYYVLYHTGQLYNDEILQQYIEEFKTPEGEMLLNCYGLNESERREWRCDFKTRLESENLYDLIKDDLTERDHEKIAINRRVFLGGTE